MTHCYSQEIQLYEYSLLVFNCYSKCTIFERGGLMCADVHCIPLSYLESGFDASLMKYLSFLFTLKKKDHICKYIL